MTAAGRPRVLLFDWIGGGHHEVYPRKFAAALGDRAHVVLAMSDRSLAKLDDLDVEKLSLGDGRPLVDPSQHFAGAKRDLVKLEVATLRGAMTRARADLAIHLFADEAMLGLSSTHRLPAPLSVLLFRPRVHYPKLLGTPLTRIQMALAVAHDALLWRWRRRRDALAVMTLDEVAAQRWARRGGALAVWLPEPPVDAQLITPQPTAFDLVVTPGLARRKGLDLLAAAIAARPTELKLLLAGEVPDFDRDYFETACTEMRGAGAQLEVRDVWQDETSVLAGLAQGRCSLLAYLNHFGMSRILVETTTVGTPVVAHDYGLLGHLVRSYGLGVAVDCTNAAALRRAIETLTADGQKEAHRERLARFAERYSEQQFRRALLAGLRMPVA